MVDKDSFTGDEITVLTASGERLIVPLAWVQFESDQGEHLELVGVLSKLPVDCLLGRSSFGQTLSRDDVLRQWEKNVSVDGSKGVEAFVLTRRQKALEEAQQRADSLVDRENALALKNLPKRESKKNGLNKGDLRILFGDKDVGEEACENSVELSDSDSDGDTRADHLSLNILDRNKKTVNKRPEFRCDPLKSVMELLTRNPWKRTVSFSREGYSCTAGSTKAYGMESGLLIGL